MDGYMYIGETVSINPLNLGLPCAAEDIMGYDEKILGLWCF